MKHRRRDRDRIRLLEAQVAELRDVVDRLTRTRASLDGMNATQQAVLKMLKDNAGECVHRNAIKAAAGSYAGEFNVLHTIRRHPPRSFIKPCGKGKYRIDAPKADGESEPSES